MQLECERKEKKINRNFLFLLYLKQNLSSDFILKKETYQVIDTNQTSDWYACLTNLNLKAYLFSLTNAYTFLVIVSITHSFDLVCGE